MELRLQVRHCSRPSIRVMDQILDPENEGPVSRVKRRGPS